MFTRLIKTIAKRKKEMPENSYVASLFKSGSDRIVQKVGEEAIEVVVAAKNKSKDRLISEISDLWFHLFVLMADKEIKTEDIEKELKRRKKR